jgi:hypothetical protein
MQVETRAISRHAAAPSDWTFNNLSPVIVPPGKYLVSSSYLDIGGATNLPSRFYRILLGQ